MMDIKGATSDLAGSEAAESNPNATGGDYYTVTYPLGQIGPEASSGAAIGDPFAAYSRLELEKWLISALYSPSCTLEEARDILAGLRLEMFSPSLQLFFSYAQGAVGRGEFPIDMDLASAILIQDYELKPSDIAEIQELAYQIVTPTAYPIPKKRLVQLYYDERFAELLKETEHRGLEARLSLRRELEALLREEAQLTGGWQVASVRELLAIAERAPVWDVTGLIPHRTMAIIAGPPKSGKSYLALDLALALASGGQFLGLKCEKRRVLFVEEEDSDFRLAGRIKRLLRGRSLEERGEELSIRFLIRQGVRLDERESLARLKETIRAENAEVVILDVFRRLWSGNENDQAQVQPLLNGLARLAEELNCTVLLIHHTRKAPPERFGSKNRRPIEEISGSGALGAWSEVTLALEPRGKDLCLTIISKDAGSFKHVCRLVETDDGQGLRLEDLGEPEELASKRSLEARERYLDAIRELGRPTKGQLARRLGISTQSAGAYIRKLEEEGAVETARVGKELIVWLAQEDLKAGANLQMEVPHEESGE